MLQNAWIQFLKLVPLDSTWKWMNSLKVVEMSLNYYLLSLKIALANNTSSLQASIVYHRSFCSSVNFNSIFVTYDIHLMAFFPGQPA